MTRTRSSRLIGVVVLAAGILATGGSPGWADPGPPTVVVDDDGAQCGSADAATIQAGVDLASPGARVHVCPGTYTERVVIDLPLTLEGAPDAVGSVDCLDPSTSDPEDLDPTRFAVLRSTGEDGPLVRVEADDVRVTGMVVQGHVDPALENPAPTITLVDAAVAVDDRWSRVRLDRNLLQLNDLGVELGSPDGRVDANCFRDNTWSLANQRHVLRGARVDHNTSVRARVIAWEIGWSWAAAEDVRLDHNMTVGDGYAGIYLGNARRARVDHNTAVAGGGTAIHVEASEDAEVAANDVRTAVRGIGVFAANVGVRVVDNMVTSTGQGTGQHGIIVTNPQARPATTGLVLSRNVVRGMTGAPGIGIFLASNAQPVGAVLADNVAADNGTEGLAVAAGNSGGRYERTVATGNGVNGVRVALGARENLFSRTTALGQPFDVRDGGLAGEGVLSTSNRWVRTTCVVDVPTGLICGR